ncbi:mitochondrial carrier domain-containing protein [Kalaharituber pfeilii]|nr:mitochondrial carrier domain-containing protein [Kalaharituber pfeilii]
MDRESQLARDARVLKLWQTLDTRKEGHLDLEGLRQGLKRIDHPLKDADHVLQDILEAIDTSKDGLIQFEEFKEFINAADKELWQIFHSVDLDSNGKIDKAELRQALDKAGIDAHGDRLEEFFEFMDKNRDGVVSYEEWRDFLMFMPNSEASIHTIYSYYLSTVNVNPEGDALLSNEINLQGLGYFLAGGLAGTVSRTVTAPFDRIKVYLIAQTDVPKVVKVLGTAVKGEAAAATKAAARPIEECIRALWRAGGIRSFFAGNGLNIVKVLPESAIKFGSFETTKRALAKLEGVEDVRDISSTSRFLAGGVGGVASQFSIYPIDTVKFRLQCELVEGGLRGNHLLANIVRNMWKSGGVSAFYRGLPLGLIGVFPYSAIDLGTFELLKRAYTKHKAKRLGCPEQEVQAGPFVVLGIGATSGSVGASVVYPLNLLRTRLQAQGTAAHPQTYTGLKDCFTKTYHIEGVRGLFKGLSPNLLKVVPSVSISYLVYEWSKNLMGLSG